MGTRLLSEHMIKQLQPRLKYVRAYTTGKNKATLYAWDDDLGLSESDAGELQRFADSYLPPYVCYRVKAYSELQRDGVPPAGELPEWIVEAAMKRDLDQDGVIAVMNGMLGNGGIVFSRYDFNSGTLHFNIHTTTALTDIEKELLDRYLSEIIPLGTRCELAYWSGNESSRLRSG
ncbi:hypothetical protein ACFPPD_20335 [Cohnella suwonensis]|uniref:Uncharacterized protein n=1 Tax=Cohnella suwonensis TaxID=696072 RepID=A0ABW0M0H7_9BACL